MGSGGQILIDLKSFVFYNNYIFNYQEFPMKFLCLIALVAVLAGCGTVGGFVSGAGTDLTKAGEWIKNR